MVFIFQIFVTKTEKKMLPLFIEKQPGGWIHLSAPKTRVEDEKISAILLLESINYVDS